MKINFLYPLVVAGCCLALASCSDYRKQDSPTAGNLTVYYDEGLARHITNQTRTFESQYANAEVKLVLSSENEAVQALYADSCEAIVISRLLNANENKAFESKGFFPKYSAVAKSGIALITNLQTPVNQLQLQSLVDLVSTPFTVKDSTGATSTINVLFDKKNSAVLHYVQDSLLKDKKLSGNCNILNSTLESINYVAQNKNTIAFIDFAWLSDMDDSVYNANMSKIKFIALGTGDNAFYYPDQSNFKLGTYPLTRTVYVIRKTGDFTLAKGFESYMAGPKGQLTFLKQGLLPARQGERSVHINLGGAAETKE